jgi:hypothetical protein
MDSIGRRTMVIPEEKITWYKRLVLARRRGDKEER